MIHKRYWKLVAQLYDAQPLAVDMLPYTEEFEGIRLGVRSGTPGLEVIKQRDLWLTLIAMRKKGLLRLKSGQDRDSLASRRASAGRGKGFGLA